MALLLGSREVAFDQIPHSGRVRLVWEGVPLVNVDTRVHYYANGISHFDVLSGHLRMAWLYRRLALGMVPRARRLLARRVEQAR
jgi:hypothetical protein